MNGILKETINNLAKQSPGILGIVIVVIMAFASLRYQSTSMIESVKIQAAVTADAVKIQTLELKSVIDRNTDAFMRIHEHYEQMIRMLERR